MIGLLLLLTSPWWLLDGGLVPGPAPSAAPSPEGDEAVRPTAGRADAAGAAPTPAASATRVAHPELLPLGRDRHGRTHYRSRSDGAVYVVVPGATLRSRTHRRDRVPGPVRRVEVPGFLIAVHEVTVAGYARFLAETGFRAPRFADAVAPHPDWPMLGLDVEEARAYARWAGGRLPTLHEWQLAAGGPEGRIYPWGEGAPDSTRARYVEGPIPLLPDLDPDPVGSHPAGASPYGVLDMAGNAEEWVLARGRDLHGIEVEDPEAWIPVGVGGSWMYDAANLRTWSFRNWNPTSHEPSNGMRVVVDLVDSVGP